MTVAAGFVTTIDAHLLRRNPRRALERLRDVAPGLAVFAKRPVLGAVVTDPELLYAVLTSGTDFVKSPATLRFRYAIGDGNATSQHPSDGSAYYHPFASQDDFRRAKRRAILPAFRPGLSDDYARVIGAQVAGTVAGWGDGEVRDTYADLTQLTALVGLECLFGRPPLADALQAAELARLSAEQADRSLRTGTTPFDRGERSASGAARCPHDHDPGLLVRRREAIERAVDALLETPGKDPERADDLVTLLHAMCHAHGGATASAQLRTSLAGLLFAAYENTAATGAWALWSLAVAPEVQQRVADEIDGMGEVATAEAAKHLPYLRACVAETLRLYPPVWSTAREATRAITIRGYRLPAGAVLILSPWVQHYRPVAWREPHRFDPGRFLDGARPSPGNYFPFGAGPRSCVGEPFAWLELTVILATILRHYHVERDPGVAAPEPFLAITQRPRPGVLLRLCWRHRSVERP